jgi:hypothetical protein
MHTADATRRKDLDPGQFCADHRGCDRRGPGAAHGQTGGQIGAGQFHDVFRLTQRLQFGLCQADVDAARHHGDGGGDSAGLAHLCLDRASGFDVLRPGHAMGDDGGFQCHDRATLGPGLGHFGGQGQKSIQMGHEPTSLET